MEDRVDRPRRLQLHLTLPYKFEAREDPRIRGYLADGYRISQLQRLTDREALVTLERPLEPDPAPTRPLNPSGA
jgi:hypothetical protein